MRPRPKRRFLENRDEGVPVWDVEDDGGGKMGNGREEGREGRSPRELLHGARSRQGLLRTLTKRRTQQGTGRSSSVFFLFPKGLLLAGRLSRLRITMFFFCIYSLGFLPNNKK